MEPRGKSLEKEDSMVYVVKPEASLLCLYTCMV